MQRLLLIEPLFFGESLIEAAERLKIPLLVFTKFGDKISKFRSMHGDVRVTVVDTLSPERMKEALPHADSISGVLSGTEFLIPETAIIADHVKKGRYIGHDTGMVCRYKDKMRLRLQEKSVSIPKFVVVTSTEQALEGVKKIGFPCVFKPTDRAGSLNIRQIENENELLDAFQAMKEPTPIDGLLSNRPEVLIEEVMEGAEFSVETFSVRGEIEFLSVTEKETTGKPLFIETGHHVPTLNYPHLVKDISSFAAKVVRALGITEGASHCEVMYTKDGPKSVECASRNGGGQIMDLVKIAYGVDLFEAAVLNSIGQQPDLVAKKDKSAVIRFICTQHNPANSAKSILSELKRMKGVADFRLEPNLGARPGDHKSVFDRIGYIICEGNSPAEANRKIKEAFEKNGVNIDP